MMWAHKNYCHLKARCVKCACNHLTNQCHQEERLSDVRCVLCGGNHPANYKGLSWYVVWYVLVSSTLVGLATRHYFLSENCCLKFAVFFLWVALTDERTGLQFAVQSLNGPSRTEPVTLYSLI
jgi:hypothetical protein